MSTVVKVVFNVYLKQKTSIKYVFTIVSFVLGGAHRNDPIVPTTSPQSFSTPHKRTTSSDHTSSSPKRYKRNSDSAPSGTRSGPYISLQHTADNSEWK